MQSPRAILSPADLTDAEIAQVLATARALKAEGRPRSARNLRVCGLYFNPSLRTRVTWEQAAYMLGGFAQTLNAGGDTWKIELDPGATMDQDSVENVVEAAGVLGRTFDVVGVRSFAGAGTWDYEKTEPVLQAFARYVGRPLVSLEGTSHHPCQSLADLLTMHEQFGDLVGMPVVLSWAWHPNPLPMAVPHSFALQAARAGCDLTIVRPEGYGLDEDLMSQVHAAAARHGRTVKETDDRAAGLAGARVVYVKSWGRKDLWHDKDAERAGRPALRDWEFGEAAWAHTDQAKVMHCLPTRRNAELSGSILDSDRSLVLEEAENRLWVQAGLIDLLTGGQS